MKKKNPLKTTVGILCLILLILAATVAVILDSQSPNPILGIFQSETTAPTGETEGGAEQIPTQGADDPTGATNATDTPAELPDDLPPSVELPENKDPETGESVGISFPCRIPEYGLVVEKMAPYNGMFVEDGSNVTVKNVAMLMVHNDGNFPIEYTQIRVQHGEETLLFDISALPVGERLVVQEKNGKTITDDKADSATALVVQRADMEMSEGKVRVIDNGNNTLTIQNLTNETIPTVRVFYKYYMENEKIFVGGIAFTVRIARLMPGASVTVQPSHYTSQNSSVVMVLTYDSEV